MKPDPYKQEISRRYKKKHGLVEKKPRKTPQLKSNAYRYDEQEAEEAEEVEEDEEVSNTMKSNSANNFVSICDEFEFKKKEYFHQIDSKKKNVREVIFIPSEVLEAFHLGHYQSNLAERNESAKESISRNYPLVDYHKEETKHTIPSPVSTITTTTTTTTTNTRDLDDLIDDLISSYFLFIYHSFTRLK